MFVNRICQCLQGTKGNGVLFNPSKNMVINYYSDADFMELWGLENYQDPIYVKIRTEFLVNFSIFLYCGYQNYRKVFISLLYIMSVWNCITMLETYFP